MCCMHGAVCGKPAADCPAVPHSLQWQLPPVCLKSLGKVCCRAASLAPLLPSTSSETPPPQLLCFSPVDSVSPLLLSPEARCSAAQAPRMSPLAQKPPTTCRCDRRAPRMLRSAPCCSSSPATAAPSSTALVLAPPVCCCMQRQHLKQESRLHEDSCSPRCCPESSRAHAGTRLAGANDLPGGSSAAAALLQETHHHAACNLFAHDPLSR